MSNAIAAVMFGCGNFSRRYHVPALLADPAVTLTAIFDPSCKLRPLGICQDLHRRSNLMPNKMRCFVTSASHEMRTGPRLFNRKQVCGRSDPFLRRSPGRRVGL